MNNGMLYSLLNATAWRMEAPQLFGAFHITAALAVSALATAAAMAFARSNARHGGQEGRLVRILAGTGWILVVLEIYKQLFLYHIVGGGAYDWWYFPFQLCSVPMYLCVLLPFVRGRLRDAFLTFMSGYTFVSAAAALIYPEDFLRPYVSLTLHGFIWHGLLLFISLVIMFSFNSRAAGTSLKRSNKSLSGAAALFAVMCVIAVAINAAVEPLMQDIKTAHPAVVHSWAAMFYLNPYHISPQPVVSSVQQALGIPTGLILYALSISVTGSFVALISPIHRDN